MAGIIKVDRVQSDSNLAFNIAGANVAFMDASALRMVGSNVSVNGSNVIESGRIVSTAQPSGSVIQVQKTVWQTRTYASTYSKTAYMTVNITPKFSNSLILVNISLCLGYTNDFGLYLTRNGTYIQSTGFSSSYSNPVCFAACDENTYLSTYGLVQNNYMLYDTPATTSQCTYEFGTYPVGGNNANIYLNRESAGTGAGTSTMVVMEIAQ